MLVGGSIFRAAGASEEGFGAGALAGFCGDGENWLGNCARGWPGTAVAGGAGAVAPLASGTPVLGVSMLASVVRDELSIDGFSGTGGEAGAAGTIGETAGGTAWVPSR